MLNCGFEWDSVQMPLNPFDANFLSFEQQVLPEVQRRGMSALGMKSLGGDGQPLLTHLPLVLELHKHDGNPTPRYDLSPEVTVRQMTD